MFTCRLKLSAVKRGVKNTKWRSLLVSHLHNLQNLWANQVVSAKSNWESCPHLPASFLLLLILLKIVWWMLIKRSQLRLKRSPDFLITKYIVSMTFFGSHNWHKISLCVLVIPNWQKTGWVMGDPGLVVTGDDSCSRGGGFKCQHQILDGHFSHWFVAKIVSFAWIDRKWQNKPRHFSFLFNFYWH